MKLNKLLLASSLAFFICLTFGVKAQQGFGTNAPESSSVIDMTATNKGLLVPRVSLLSLTDVVTVPNAANALTVFNLANAGSNQNRVFPGYYYWNKSGSTWVRLTDNLPYNGLVFDPNNKVGLGGFLDHHSTIFYNDKSLSFLTGEEGSAFPGSHSAVLDKNGLKLRYNDGGSGVDPSIKDYYLSIENTRTVFNTNTQLGTPYDGISTGIKSIFSYGNFNNEKYIAGQFGSNVNNQIGANPIQIGVLAKVGYNNVDANNSQTIAGYFQSNNSSSAAVNNYAVYAKATGTKPFAIYADGGAVLIKDLDINATALITGIRPLGVDADGKLVTTVNAGAGNMIKDKVACSGATSQIILNANVTANATILLTFEDAGGSVISTAVGARSVGSSFTVNFSSAPATSAYVNYVIIP